MPDAQGNLTPDDPNYVPPNSSGGLINNNPAQNPQQTPATSNDPTKTPVAQATASTANPVAFTADPNNSVASNVERLISKGSPLLQQAETRAKQAAARKGLLNSSMAVSAGQSALYDAATPIATADAQIQATAANNTAAAANQAALTNAQLKTGISQSNTAAINTQTQQNLGILAQKELQASQITGQKELQQMQSDTSLTIADKQANTQKYLADQQNQMQLQLQNIQSSTTLSVADKQTQTQKLIADNENLVRAQLQQIQANTSLSIADKQALTQTTIATNENALRLQLQQIQSDTQLSAADKQTQAQIAISAADNVTKQAIAQLQSNTQMTATEKQLATQELISQRDNETKIAMQQFQLGADKEKIVLDGTVREQLANIEAGYKMLMQTSAGAEDVYKQALSNMANIISNPNISDKTKALNLQMNLLDDALKQIGVINNMDLGAYLTFETTADGSTLPVTPEPAPIIGGDAIDG